MLVLPNDSGYNSPCDGVLPSSFAHSPSKLLSDISTKSWRKLDFGTPLYANTDDDVTSTDCNCRLQEVANRLILMCDLFDDEFAHFPQQRTWTSSIATFRILNMLMN